MVTIESSHRKSHAISRMVLLPFTLSDPQIHRTPHYLHFASPFCRYASAVFMGVVILFVCPSVRHTRALWLIQRTHRRHFYTTWKGNPSSFLPLNSGWWATSLSTFNGRSKWPTPFKNRWRRQISACNVSTVRASEKSSIMTNRKSYAGFPTSYRWSAYVTSKSPKGTWLKRRTFPFFNKTQIQLNEVCYKVSLTENFQQQSCSTIIHSFPYLTVHRL